MKTRLMHTYSTTTKNMRRIIIDNGHTQRPPNFQLSISKQQLASGLLIFQTCRSPSPKPQVRSICNPHTTFLLSFLCPSVFRRSLNRPLCFQLYETSRPRFYDTTRSAYQLGPRLEWGACICLDNTFGGGGTHTRGDLVHFVPCMNSLCSSFFLAFFLWPPDLVSWKSKVWGGRRSAMHGYLSNTGPGNLVYKTEVA